MVESPLGPIPQGWEVKQLGEMCHVLMGLSLNLSSTMK